MYVYIYICTYIVFYYVSVLYVYTHMHAYTHTYTHTVHACSRAAVTCLFLRRHGPSATLTHSKKYIQIHTQLRTAALFAGNMDRLRPSCIPKKHKQMNTKSGIAALILRRLGPPLTFMYSKRRVQYIYKLEL